MVRQLSFSLKIFTLLIALVITSTGYASTCFDYFDNQNLWYYIDEANIQNGSYIARQTIRSEVESLPSRMFLGFKELPDPKQKRIKNIIYKIANDPYITEERLDSYAQSFALAYIGLPSKWTQIFRNKAKLTEQKIQAQVVQHIIKIGLKNYLSHKSQIEKKSFRTIVRITIQNSLNKFFGFISPVTQFPILQKIAPKKYFPNGFFPRITPTVSNLFNLPIRWPDSKTLNLPPEIIEKLIWEGADANLNLLNSYQQHYNFQNIYDSLSRYYTLILISAAIWIVDGMYLDSKKAQKEIVIQQVSSFGENIVSDVKEYNEKLYDEAYQNALKEFEESVQRPATQEEKDVIYRTIYENK